MAGKDKCVKLSDCFGKPKDLGTVLEKLSLGPRKKLLVMNINGFLCNRVHLNHTRDIPKRRHQDGNYRKFLVFKRPYSQEFMKFCLERFEVGIWSSAKEHNMDPALSCAIGALRHKLLFAWGQDRCTKSVFNSKENRRKPLFFKDLNTVWIDIKKGGPFSASNTLLIDDNPYKAFLNLAYTAIFPESYKLHNAADKTLHPKGKLCLFLKGLAKARDVESYVKEHPFGQPAITSSHPDYEFYSKVKESVINRGHEDTEDDLLL